ncbi:methylmalonyl-CoA epimerase [Pedobacter sp. PWIIR3]
MKNIEHIGIAVKDLAQACDLYEQLLGVPVFKKETVGSEGVETAFFLTGSSKIELLSSITDESPISKFLERKGEGIHHIAFEVEDILLEMDRLKREGFVLLNELPKKGADNKLICFVHPKNTHGVLVEICQEIKS